MKHSEVLVVGCGKAKVWSRDVAAGSMIARDAYRGALFRISAEYADTFYADRWLILSAYYGLISPQQLIDNYDVKCSRRVLPSAVERLARDINIRMPSSADRIGCLLSRDYEEWLTLAATPRTVVNYLSGMPLFDRMRVLRQSIESGEPLNIPRK